MGRTKAEKKKLKKRNKCEKSQIAALLQSPGAFPPANVVDEGIQLLMLYVPLANISIGAKMEIAAQLHKEFGPHVKRNIINPNKINLSIVQRNLKNVAPLWKSIVTTMCAQYADEFQNDINGLLLYFNVIETVTMRVSNVAQDTLPPVDVTNEPILKAYFDQDTLELVNSDAAYYEAETQEWILYSK